MVYNSIKICPVFNFFESFNDVRYLIAQDNYIELPILKDIEIEKLNKIKENLQIDYQEMSQSGVNINFDKTKTVIYLEYNKYLISVILNTLEYKYSGIKADYDFLEDYLEQIDYKLNYTDEKSFNKEIERLRHRLLGYDNKINKLKLELNAKTPKKENNYLTVVLLIEQYANIRIDIYKDSVLKFIEAEKRLSKHLKQIEVKNANSR